MAKSSKIIIKKVAHQDHEGGHGGSWKVAYADFVTAMMAFFLLMWLLAMLEPDKRDRLADFFVEYSLINVLKGEPGYADSPAPQARATQPQGGDTPRSKSYPINLPHEASPDEIQARLAMAIESRLADVKDQVLVEVDGRGVRIEIVDKEGRMLFSRGSSEPSETAKRVLKVMAETLSGLDNRLTIIGHTDSTPFTAQSRLSNWELSSFRALAARREMESWGMDNGRLSLVAGAADSQPLMSQNPQDPRNRRISIRVLDAQAGETSKLPANLAPAEPSAPAPPPPSLPSTLIPRPMPGLGQTGDPGRTPR